MKVLRFLALVVLLSAGCSVFPGLRVLNGEDPAQIQSGDQVVAQSDLVMADKSGSTDPSLMLAADRIEAASGNVDIIEIRRDEKDDMFVTNLLFRPPSDANSQTQEGLISLYTAIQRAVELTWQGTMAESQNLSALKITFIAPQAISTLDNGGMSFVGFILLNAQIERADAIKYLSGPRTLSNFLDLIANGTMSYESPQQTELYQGQPNHPLFMLNAATAATSN
jgi:hypothetical protein